MKRSSIADSIAREMTIQEYYKKKAERIKKLDQEKKNKEEQNSIK